MCAHVASYSRAYSLELTQRSAPPPHGMRAHVSNHTASGNSRRTALSYSRSFSFTPPSKRSGYRPQWARDASTPTTPRVSGALRADRHDDSCPYVRPAYGKSVMRDDHRQDTERLVRRRRRVDVHRARITDVGGLRGGFAAARRHGDDEARSAATRTTTRGDLGW